jgi:hypothetical protein
MSFLAALTPAFRVPAECVVLVGDDQHEMTNLYDFLSEVTVECSRKEAATARLKFETRRDEQGQFVVQDDPDIAAWQPIMISAGFGSRTEEVFRGFMREVKAEYPEDPARPTVTVECQDESLALDREHFRRRWMDQAPTSDQVIVTTILGNYTSPFGGALAMAASSGAGLSGITLNQDATDAKFLRERAEANGYELIFGAGTVHFGPMRLSAAAQATILVYGGSSTNCISFSATVDGHAPNQVGFDLADPDSGASRRVTVSPDLALLGARRASDSQSGLSDFVWVMAREGSADEPQLTAMAQQKVNDLSLRVHAQGELDGSLYGHVLGVGLPVGVDGAGDDFSGTYYVDTVTHRFSATGYRQSFALLRNGLGNDLDSRGIGGTVGQVTSLLGSLFG